jgi:IS30 family transposase
VKDPALKDQFIELRAQGVSFAVIAERLGVAKSTLIT